MITNMLRGIRKRDDWLTPDYAVKPIIPYLKGKRIWCPFDREDSAYVGVLTAYGFEVVYTHIEDGTDFFAKNTVPQQIDAIVSNPPFSKRAEVFERLLELGVPFAMLQGAAAGLFEGKMYRVFNSSPPNILWLSPRVAYIDPCTRQVVPSPPFQSCYVCYGVLPLGNSFARIER